VGRYGVAVWTPGNHTLTLPPLWRLGPDGRSDSSAGGAASIVVASVIPDTLKGPDPRGPLGPLRLERRNPGPPLAAALVSIGLLAAGVAARRRSPRDLLEQLDRVAFGSAQDGDVVALAARARRLAKELAP